jgi:hypothetical protein
MSRSLSPCTRPWCGVQCALCPTLQRVPEDTKAAGYRTWLGFYKGYCGKIGWSPEELVQQANYFSEVIGERGGSVTGSS